MEREESMVEQLRAVLVPGFLLVLTIGVIVCAVSAGVVFLGMFLSYLSGMVVQGATVGVFHYMHVLVVLALCCSAIIGVPLLLLARSLQRLLESFSLLPLDEEFEDDDEENGEDGDWADENEELNDFLKKLHKTRNIGPFIPSPKTMNDLCPCGSGLKYKDCCGKFWN